MVLSGKSGSTNTLRAEYESGNSDEVADTLLPGKPAKRVIYPTVPQTDTGRRGENPKAFE